MIVCADDYGMREDVDGAILALARSARLSAVSCMVLLEQCDERTLAPLLDLGSAIDIGLHLCLADESLAVPKAAGEATAPARLPSYADFARAAIGGKVSQEQARRAISEQYELFVAKCRRKPDFVDGHLYVHQLPSVREALIEFIARLGKDGRPYVRNTRMSVRGLWRKRLPWAKAAVISFFGARMAEKLRARNLPTNAGFAGIYDFKWWRKYPSYLPAFVKLLRDRNSMLVVHPGRDEDWRRQEYEALSSYQFAEGCPNRFGPAANSGPTQA